MTSEQKNHQVTPIASDDDALRSLGNPTGQLAVGQWYWVLGKKSSQDWLGCLMQIGSNYVEIEGPKGEANSYHCCRVHFDDISSELRLEHDPIKVIRDNAQHYHGLAQKYLDEVRDLTARLGMSSQSSIGQGGQNGSALAVMSAQVDIQQYRKDLVLAKDKTLPDLFKKIKSANIELTRWMSAEMMPMLAASRGMEESISTIGDRVFNVSLYAGLEEQVQQCCGGQPADSHEKLHVMQRKLYMDEECLLDYKAGGIDIQSLKQFDAWIAQPHNRDRILPFNRCIVAMQVRRNTKNREWNGSLRHLRVIVELGETDKWTYLFIRNGERIYRLATELEFDEMIFPDSSHLQPGEPMMVKMFGDRVDRLMSLGEYETLREEWRARKRLSDQWEKANPGADSWKNPHRARTDFRPDDWTPFDQDNVYFDEAEKYLQGEIKKYNRIALIIQGLFDRSEVLHPHPPVKTWTPQGFEAAIELVPDASRALTYGEAPDFEAYRARCNATLGAGSTVVGQEDYWLRKEGEKETARRDRDYRFSKVDYRPTRHQPYGNPGPGFVTKVDQWKPRSAMAVFQWNRERLRDSGNFGPRAGANIRTSISVPASELFNIDAYQLGDFRQFFQDPRTRQHYLKWAPLLIAAEEHHLAKQKTAGG